MFRPHSTSPYSTSTAIPHHIFNITHFTPHHVPHHITPPHLDFTSHRHIWHHNTLHHFPHLTSNDNHTAYCICHILHHHNSTPHFTSHRNFPHLALCNIPHHRTPQFTQRHIPHHTFCISIAFHITPCLKWQHSTSHHISHTYHISHQITPPHRHTVPHHARIPHHTTCTSRSNINHTSHYPTAHTAFQPAFRIKLIWRQTIPHYSVFHNHISHLASVHHHIPHVPHHHSTLHRHISHVTLHDITFSIAPHRTYSTSHLIPHHSHIRMNKAQHPTSGIAKRHITPNSTPHYSTSRHVMWWYWNMWNVWCRMM